MNKVFLRKLGSLFLLLSAFLFAFLGIISMWGDMEASVFNSAIKSDKPLSTLRCPVFITPNDDAVVSARIYNPSDRELEMEIRTYISFGSVVSMKEITTNFMLKPGESEVINIPITTQDTAFDRVVLVRMHQIRRGSLPYLNASCGVTLIRIPYIKGSQIVILILSLGTLLSAIGMTLWIVNTQPIVGDRLKTLIFLISFTALSILNCLVGLLGLWGLAMFITIIWVLLGIGKIGQLALKAKATS